MANSNKPAVGKSGYKPKGKPRGGWKKGQSGNPEGARKGVSPDLKQFREISLKQFLKSLQQYGLMNNKEIESDLGRTDITQFEQMFAKIIISAKNGNISAQNIIMARLWGPIKDAVSETDKEPTARVMVVELPDNGRSNQN